MHTPAAGPGQVGIPKREQRGHREAAARRVARDRDVLGGDALVEKPAIGGHGVVEGRRKGMLGRQAIVEQERVGARRARDGGREMAMGARRPDHVAAAVEVEHDMPRSRRRRAEPFRGRRARGHALDLDVGWTGEDLLRALVLGAALGDGQRVRRGELCQVGANDLDAAVCHVIPPRVLPP